MLTNTLCFIFGIIIFHSDRIEANSFEFPSFGSDTIRAFRSLFKTKSRNSNAFNAKINYFDIFDGNFQSVDSDLYQTNAYSDDASSSQSLQCGIRKVNYEPARQFRSGRIIGGHDVPYGAFPWQVEIQIYNHQSRKFKHHCGGALIDDQIVITAAHCLQVPKLQYLRVVFGNHFLMQRDLFEHSYRVEDMIIHPSYRRDGPYSNDIGLLRIRTPHSIGIGFNTHIRPICLPPKELSPSPGAWCTVTGWGAHDADNIQDVASSLRAASVPILDLDICRQSTVNGGRVQKVLDTMLCAGFLQGGVDACSGDSGGPLTCEINGKFYLSGIVSWGDGCARINRPGIYTKVDSYSGWIEESIQKLKS